MGTQYPPNATSLPFLSILTPPWLKHPRVAGRPSGRFLLRCRIKKPKEYQSDDPARDSLFYLSSDLYVGAIVKFNEHTFLLTEADDYVFAFMERDDERERCAGARAS